MLAKSKLNSIETISSTDWTEIIHLASISTLKEKDKYEKMQEMWTMQVKN